VVHRTAADFWNDYELLPKEIQRRADKQFALLNVNQAHPSLQFKKIGRRHDQEIWSARVTLKYRALAFKDQDEFVWFWIGEHNMYDMLTQ